MLSNITHSQYQIIGRYMEGNCVKAYHLVNEQGLDGRVEKEDVYFLLGLGLIVNAKAEVCSNECNGINVKIIGVGTNLATLPVLRNNYARESHRAEKEANNKLNKIINNLRGRNVSVYTDEHKQMIERNAVSIVIKTMYLHKESRVGIIAELGAPDILVITDSDGNTQNKRVKDIDEAVKFIYEEVT